MDSLPTEPPGKPYLFWKCLKVKESEVAQLCLTLSDPMDYSLPGFSIHGILQARVLEWGAIAFSETSPRDTNFKSESESHSVMSDSLQPHGLYSPWNFPDQNTGVGSPSLLQGIFPTQGSNWGLLHCRWILYQLSYQGRCYKYLLEKWMNK